MLVLSILKAPPPAYFPLSPLWAYLNLVFKGQEQRLLPLWSFPKSFRKINQPWRTWLINPLWTSPSTLYIIPSSYVCCFLNCELLNGRDHVEPKQKILVYLFVEIKEQPLPNTHIQHKILVVWLRENSRNIYAGGLKKKRYHRSLVLYQHWKMALNKSCMKFG